MQRYLAQSVRKLSTEAAPRLQTSVILTRSPTLSHTPTPFESAYYAYQARLARTLSSPFPSEFYFKKGSLLERKFNAEERAREAATFGEDFGGLEGEERVEDVPSEEDEVVVLPRESEADRTGDVKSLNRRGERNLYLLVKDTASGEWRFPQGDANLEQPLHDTAKNELHALCGPNMDTWIVGRHPIGVLDDPEAKIFFFKGHIFAGQASPSPTKIADFAWLAREEIQSRVEAAYWEGVEDMLPRV